MPMQTFQQKLRHRLRVSSPGACVILFKSHDNFWQQIIFQWKYVQEHKKHVAGVTPACLLFNVCRNGEIQDGRQKQCLFLDISASTGPIFIWIDLLHS